MVRLNSHQVFARTGLGLTSWNENGNLRRGLQTLLGRFSPLTYSLKDDDGKDHCRRYQYGGEGMEDMEGIEDIINTSLAIPTTSTQSNNVQPAHTSTSNSDTYNVQPARTSTSNSDTYNVQPARNRSLKILALYILKHLPPDFSSIKSNEAIPDYGSCQECEIPILTEDPPRSLVLNVCGDVIHRTCANKVDNRGALPCSCGVVDDSDPLLPLEEVANNSNESRKRTSVEDTSSRKKARTRKRSKGVSPMLKKLIEELKTLPSSVEDNSESQPEAPGSFTDLHEAIIQAEGRTVTNNHEIIRAYYSFGKELENRLTFHKIANSERRAQRKLNDEVGKQLPNDLSQNAIEKRVERARKIYDLFSGIGIDKIQRVSYSALRISKLDWDEIDIIKEAFELYCSRSRDFR
ncbi:hypothetical protein GLOIN_2v1770914 [Rhizophagus clarus]|uniref:RING-type domain-containing protein n=2 Tax=Rhizophagus clarus TaxID=94130 RepID=A0A8H3M1M8_9GLOM|nr:hypothetical protein GLOIN_2v1770914 [Rhizophagus clarus]